jgi:hypothetical protein
METEHERSEQGITEVMEGGEGVVRTQVGEVES